MYQGFVFAPSLATRAPRWVAVISLPLKYHPIRAEFVEALEGISEDLKGAEILLKSLIGAASGDGPPEEKKVWLVYLAVEKSVALLKLHLSVESPGLFVTIKSGSKDWAGLLAIASRTLADGRRHLEEGRLEEALETLRSSRNCLRVFLRDSRKLRLRALRAANRTGR